MKGNGVSLFQTLIPLWTFKAFQVDLIDKISPNIRFSWNDKLVFCQFLMNYHLLSTPDP